MSAQPEVADLVLADLAQRKKMGIAKYGRPLTAFTLQDNLWEAYEEQMDHLIYLRAEIERRGGRRQ